MPLPLSNARLCVGSRVRLTHGRLDIRCQLSTPALCRVGQTCRSRRCRSTLSSWQVRPCSSRKGAHELPTDTAPPSCAVFASLVAPFGGFFASGFKRAFKIKVRAVSRSACALRSPRTALTRARHHRMARLQDFGDSIPGHGGFTDRMDCQIIMGLFVYIYVTHVVSIGGGEGVSDLLVKAEALPSEQQVRAQRAHALCHESDVAC